MRRPSWLSPAVLTILVAGATMMSVAMGVRQSFGLLMAPLSAERAWPLATFSLAVALQNLLWGAFQPFTGAAADRWGAAPVAAAGILVYAAGLALSAAGGQGAALAGIGLAAGLGIAATSFAVVLGPVGRAVAPDRRAAAMGAASAAGSIGMMAMIPMAQGLLAGLGPTGTLWALAATCLAVAPLALLLHRGEQAALAPGRAVAGPGMGLKEALAEAAGHRGYRLLALGFFVCGFQIAFIGVHLPNYLALCGFSKGAGATALLVIGGFNTLGTWAAGELAGRFRPKYLLSGIYLLRGVESTLFVLAPKSETSMLLFAGAIGLIWLSTVPLTSSLIATVFGPKHLGTLFGIVFFSHQVGAFLGAWLGGIVYDATLSYDSMWVAAVVLGVLAAAVHLPIRDETLRTQAA